MSRLTMPIHQRIQSRVELLQSGLQLRGAIGVEVGVAGGFFSERILGHTEIDTLYSIDPWSRGFDEPLDVAHTSTIELYLEALKRLRQFGSRSILYRLKSCDAAPLFENESLDFVYIDGSHVYEDVRLDISIWWPKMKPGGIFWGHDYSGNCPGVMRAVDEFIRETGLPWGLTECDEVNIWTIHSWYVLKPEA